MAKIRIFELAKEIGKESKEIIEFLGGELKSQSGLEDHIAENVRKHFNNKKTEEKDRQMEEKAKNTIKDSEKTTSEEKKNVSAEAEEPKKKKPIFVFRPENSGYNGNSRQQKGNNTSQKQNAQRKENEGKKRSDNNKDRRDRRDNGGMNNGQRRVIKPNVPTTAETYKELAREEAVKPVAEEKTKVAAPEKTDAPENTPVQEVKVNEAVKAETPAVEKTSAPAPAETAPVQEAAPAAPAKPVRKNVFREMEEKKRQQELKKQQEAQEKKNQPASADNRNNRNKNAQNRNNQNRNKDNREGSQSGQARSGRPNFHFSENGNRQGSTGSQNRNNNNQNRNNNQNNNRNRNAAASAAPAPAFSGKSDVRGKKNNKSDKDRRNDGTGRNQENLIGFSKKNEQAKKPVQKKEEEVIKMIVIPEIITLKDLADKMKMKPADLIKKLFLKGKMVTLNTELSYEEAEEIALEYDILCEMEEKVDVIEELLKEEDEDEKLMVKRPPVVCVMGHVDHGKTSLLDKIRQTNVTAREAGGITQHIGAYMVEYNGEKITFLDTPGHEAFTAMRMRGAQATDIAILVVAADDGVMPQTVEAINHAKAAGVEVIVAVNKIDKPEANVDRVKQELTEYDLIAEDWGGSTVFVPVSAKTGEGIENLLEMVLLVTEVKELKANPNRAVRGIVIEAKLDKGRGPVATVLIQKGTLKVGDFVSAGSNYGRVRAMLDADGNQLKTAGPSTPVEILGLNGVPNAGEICIGHKNEKDARSYADTFVAEEKKQKLAETKQKLTMDSLFEQIQAGEIKELPIIVKADVQGSVEAVKSSLEKLSNEEVAVKVIHSGVGAINESDISLASASNAIVIGFNVKPDTQAKNMAETESVDVKLYRVIYQAIEDVERALKGMQAPVYEEQILGHAEVRQTFKASGVGVIAGCYVTDGTIERNCQVRITRGKDQIYEGPLVSLKRFKDDVREAREGYECGMVFEKFNDLMEGDVIEAYKMVQVNND